MLALTVTIGLTLVTIVLPWLLGERMDETTGDPPYVEAGLRHRT